MNKEGVNKYNELLITYINEFVSSFEEKTEIRDRATNDMIDNLEKQLIEYNITIQRDQISKLIDNGFNMYTNILKTYFDSAGIHRINDQLSINDIAKEMNEVTTNLSKAINSSNKMQEYVDFVQKIKDTITYIISQTNTDYQAHEYEISQVLNDVVNSFFSLYTTDKIDLFNRDKLTELFKISDDMSYKSDQIEENPNTYPNEDRDRFINETMDIEIHEGFENGQVTLTIIDGLGNETHLHGWEAIEQLKSYNQLYESSRPGRKADTSNWPSEEEIYEDRRRSMMIADGLNPDVDPYLKHGNNLDNNLLSHDSNLDTVDIPVIKQPTNPLTNLNNDGNIPNLMAVQNDFGNNRVTPELVAPNNQQPVVQTPQYSSNDFFNNLTFPTNGEEPNNQSNLNTSNPVAFANDYTAPPSEQDQNEEMIKNFLNKYKNDSLTGNLTVPNYTNLDATADLSDQLNALAPNSDLNNNFVEPLPVREENIPQQDNNPYLPPQNVKRTPYATSFITAFENPNYDRDQFIKKSTGIEIQEDLDNNGRLFLRVTEPSGREVIYTDKEAARMIRNYNKAFLDAFPDAKVDTSLIDGYE